MKKLLSFLILVTFYSGISMESMARVTNFAGGKKAAAKSSASPAVNELFKAEKANYSVGDQNKAPAMQSALLEDVYKVYGVEGLQKLNAATTRDELKIILTGMKDSSVAMELIEGAVPTRIADSLAGTAIGNNLSTNMVDVSIFEAIETGGANIDWSPSASSVEECSLCCLPCCH